MVAVLLPICSEDICRHQSVYKCINITSINIFKYYYIYVLYVRSLRSPTYLHVYFLILPLNVYLSCICNVPIYVYYIYIWYSCINSTGLYLYNLKFIRSVYLICYCPQENIPGDVIRCTTYTIHMCTCQCVQRHIDRLF